MKTVSELFGSMVFNDAVMKERLPEDVYRSLQNTIKNGKHLDLSLANVVAGAMKDWAIEKGATHYTHWFQPMTNFHQTGSRLPVANHVFLGSWMVHISQVCNSLKSAPQQRHMAHLGLCSRGTPGKPSSRDQGGE